MTNIIELAQELKDIVSWQRTPEELEDADYIKMIINGIKTLYIDTGRASEYSNDMIVYSGLVDPEIWFTVDLPIDEEKYVLIVAQIAFFKKVQSDVNNIVSYTTDAQR